MAGRGFGTAIGRRYEAKAATSMAKASKWAKTFGVGTIGGFSVMAGASVLGPAGMAVGLVAGGAMFIGGVASMVPAGYHSIESGRARARGRALEHLVTRARIAKGAAIRADADGAGAGAVGHYSRNAAAAGNLGDGMTDSYTRLSASGNAVQVAAYTTPKR